MGESKRAVLVIDDRRAAEGVRAGAESLGLRVHEASSLSEGLRRLSEEGWVASFVSLDLPGMDLGLVSRIREQEGCGALVLLAAAPSLRQVMEATALGAVEVLTAPQDPEAVVRVLAAATAGEGGVPLPPVAAEPDELVGTSPALLDVFKAVGRVAASPATVLVTGASGTGKELVARAIHRGSPRAEKPFVAVNCAAIPEDLLESELFGHERGAFTGAVARKVGRWERAQGGTLFLDEIGDMSLVLQAKILRALQEREIERLGGEERIAVDVRVVAATHRDLAGLIHAGEFREDLYYRLAVVRLELPPLRERPGDVELLALHFAALFTASYARPVRAISREALDRLFEHDWPGNVRELRNVLERAVLQCTGPVLLASHISLDARAARAKDDGDPLPGYAPDLTMAEVEALHLRRVLESVDWHYGRAAEILGMHRNTVSRKAQEYGLATEPDA